jgi:hypothetical protein
VLAVLRWLSLSSSYSSPAANLAKREIRCIADVFCEKPIPIIPASPDGSLELGNTPLRVHAPHSVT